jgi:hypothetical protein
MHVRLKKEKVGIVSMKQSSPATINVWTSDSCGCNPGYLSRRCCFDWLVLFFLSASFLF